MVNNGYIQMQKDDEWYSPKWIIEKLGSFDYDPATNERKAAEFNIKHYDTIKTDGLKQDWTKYKKIWINPPFTLKKEFFKKAVETYDKSGAEIYMLFPIAFLTTRTFNIILEDRGGVLYLPNGRIKFESGNGRCDKSPAFGSIIFRIGGRPDIKVERIKIY